MSRDRERNHGSLDMTKLLADWQVFWREDGHVAAEGFAYREAGPHLMWMAFLRRILPRRLGASRIGFGVGGGGGFGGREGFSGGGGFGDRDRVEFGTVTQNIAASVAVSVPMAAAWSPQVPLCGTDAVTALISGRVVLAT